MPTVMKFSRHFAGSLESMANKLRQKCFIRVAYCRNLQESSRVLVRRTFRETIDHSFHDLSGTFNGNQAVERGAPFNNGARNWGRRDSWFFSDFLVVPLHWPTSCLDAVKLRNSVNNFPTTSFSVTILPECLSRTMIEIVKSWWKIIFAPFGIIIPVDTFWYYLFVSNIAENKKRGNTRNGRKLFCIYSFVR